ncbi:hypothetical protein GCM10022243_31360 [Saccharothrix violaceirubra]|uniref:Methylamine utilisation protein MauE domain-containing protein n=1 Tax=Saccharothrix violaceirubra TaxID=413306 RepID=A0A7W7T562_9PSEU|nr:MauE/DoxX family redox-associated membrane protein [Saccharothrix violaceirubra]MBB4966760.1 hypothetical protein [Saccharothrix violaceirubra]
MNALTEFAEAQPPLLALLLVVAGAAKLLPVVRGSGIAPTGVLALVPRRYRGAASTTLACAEVTLGIALLCIPALSVRLAVAASFAAAVLVVGFLWRRKPEAGCGCFGDLSGERVGARTLVRTCVVAVLAGIALGGRAPVSATLTDLTAVHVTTMVIEVGVIAALSPELALWWVRLRGRSVPCAYRRVPSAHALGKLRAHAEWHRYAELLTAAEPFDEWRDLCWQMFAFPGCRDGLDVDVVFAVHLDGRGPEVRVAVVTAADTGESVVAGV